MRKSWVFVVMAMLVFAMVAFGADSWKGSISDKMCGADHQGKDPVKCTLACVKSGSPYVFVVSKDKILDIENQKDAKIAAQLEKFAGKNVTVTGSLSADGKSVKIDSIK
jgi:hypothetical protein